MRTSATSASGSKLHIGTPLCSLLNALLLLGFVVSSSCPSLFASCLVLSLSLTGEKAKLESMQSTHRRAVTTYSKRGLSKSVAAAARVAEANASAIAGVGVRAGVDEGMAPRAANASRSNSAAPQLVRVPSLVENRVFEEKGLEKEDEEEDDEADEAVGAHHNHGQRNKTEQDKERDAEKRRRVARMKVSGASPSKARIRFVDDINKGAAHPQHPQQQSFALQQKKIDAERAEKLTQRQKRFKRDKDVSVPPVTDLKPPQQQQESQQQQHVLKQYSNSSATGASASVSAVAVTYQRARSFLQQTALDSADAESSVPPISFIDEGLDTSSDEEEKRKELRGIHELKEAGKAARFSDEIGYLFAGLSASNPPGTRRASLLELAGKCCSNAQFLLKARAYNILSLFADLIQEETGDEIMAALLLFILCIMCQDRRNVGVLASYPNVIPFVVKSVTRPKDVLITLPRSKYERTFVEDVKRLILVSDIVEPTQVSCYALAVLSLESLLSACDFDPNIYRLLQQHDIPRLLATQFSSRCVSFLPTPSCISGSKFLPQQDAILSASQIRSLKGHLGLLRVLLRGGRNKVPVETWSAVLLALAGLYMQLCRASEEGGDSVPSFSAAVEAALMAVQLLIDACAEDARVAVAVIAGGGARVAAALAVRSWDIMERVTVAAVGGREGEDGREDRGVQAHCGMVVSGLALLANLVRNDEGLKAGLRELELNVKCPAAVSGECACLVQCCALSRILNLFKGAIHDDASPIPKSVSVILCALIGCLVSDNVDNANFVRTLTDGFVSFAEMAALLESFAQFQCEASAAAAGLDAGQMRYVTEGGEKDVEREERGILRQMDCLKGLAGVLRGLEG